MNIYISKILQQMFSTPVSNRRELLVILQAAANAQVFDKDSLPLIEAVIQFGDMRAKDIVLPRHEVDFIDLNHPIGDILQLIISTGHSRFPVVDGSSNDVVGIFHSKDIVRYIANPEQFNLQELLRQPLFVPDMKPLDSLLYEMRLKHSHLAVVVDEFTNIAGIVTLEMIVEQIVGEIDDEHDSVDGEHGIIELNHKLYRVKGYCGLEQFNNITGNFWQDDKVESVGGFVTKSLGRVPAAGEKFDLNHCAIEIISADSRKINTLTLAIQE